MCKNHFPVFKILQNIQTDRIKLQYHNLVTTIGHELSLHPYNIMTLSSKA